jgi:uncharacterized protein (TIGR02145 family)
MLYFKKFTDMKNIFLVLMLAGAVMITACTKEKNSPTTDEGVEIDGVIWATRNVDEPGTFAATPDDLGKLYQFNNPKAWSLTTTVDDIPQPNIVSGGWKEVNDPCPEGWRLPTTDEWLHLIAATPTDDDGRVYHSHVSEYPSDNIGDHRWDYTFWLGQGARATGGLLEEKAISLTMRQYDDSNECKLCGGGYGCPCTIRGVNAYWTASATANTDEDGYCNSFSPIGTDPEWGAEHGFENMYIYNEDGEPHLWGQDANALAAVRCVKK